MPGLPPASAGAGLQGAQRPGSRSPPALGTANKSRRSDKYKLEDGKDGKIPANKLINTDDYAAIAKYIDKFSPQFKQHIKEHQARSVEIKLNQP